MVILMKMIQKLLIMLDLWLSTIDLNNTKNVNKEINKELMPVAGYPTMVFHHGIPLFI